MIAFQKIIRGEASKKAVAPDKQRLCWSPSQEKGPHYMNVCLPWMCSLLRCSRICSRREDNKLSEKGQIVNTLGFASHVLSLMNLLCFLQTFKNMKIIPSLKIVWTRLFVCHSLPTSDLGDRRAERMLPTHTSNGFFHGFLSKPYYLPSP